jgi:succinoglycan biosynthesis transport protein ExoP
MQGLSYISTAETVDFLTAARDSQSSRTFGNVGTTMLQATSPLTTESEIVQENSTSELISWAIGIVRRQFAVIALIAVVGTSLGAFYAFMAPPTYTAESMIVIDPRRVQLFPKATFSEGQIDSPALESEIELVKSEPVALSVINDLGLAKDPEFFSGSQGVFGAVPGFASHFFRPASQTNPFPNLRLPGPH